MNAPKTDKRVLPDFDYAMSLDSIGKELGIGRNGAWQIQQGAIAKIKAAGMLDDFKDLLSGINPTRRA